MSGDHARLSPSAAHRWMRCPGSVRLIEGMKLPDTAGEFAAEGTLAHSVQETALRLDLPLDHFLGEWHSPDGYAFEVDEDMINYLRPGTDWIRGWAELARLYLERRVDISEFVPGCFGTVDTIIVPGEKCRDPGTPDLIIRDLKYGAGVPVRAEWNEQLMLYALGVLGMIHGKPVRSLPDDLRVMLIVDQPRVSDGWSEWLVTSGELVKFGLRANEAALEAVNEGATFNPGSKQCRFCDARGVCKPYAEHLVSTMALRFDDLPEAGNMDPEMLSPEERSEIVKARADIEAWLKAVHSRVFEDAKAGRPTPGLRLAPGRDGNRQWADSGEAENFLVETLGDRAYETPKIVSPTQAEKILGKGRLPDNLVHRTPGSERPILVPEDSDKPSLNPVDKFDDL